MLSLLVAVALSQGIQLKDGSSSSLVQIQIPGSGANTAPALLVRPAPKATYRASTSASGQVVAAASAAPFFCMQGSATKTVIFQRAYLSGANLTAVAYASYAIGKYSTAVTAGTATALTAVPLDSNSPASSVSLLNVYTAAPTAGTLVGVVSVKKTLLQATTAAAGGIPDVIEFDFRTLGGESSGLDLRGVAQGVCIFFAVAPATAVTLSLAVEWTEQATTLEP
jgi:hypothetical protein